MAAQRQQPQRIFEQFLLVTVAHGRNGAIPYTYPPVSPNGAVMDRLPKHKDIIALCFPDLEELRKIRALDFKAPAPAPGPAATLGIGTVVNQLGAHVSGDMPAAPPTLAATRSSPFSTVSSASGSYIAAAAAAAAAANSTSNITTSSLSSSSKGGFRAEFSTIALPGADDGAGGGSDRLFLVTYRCLPSGFSMRYDVGKRFPECLCFMTRHQQAVPVFQQALQQIHALRLVYAPIERIEAFLRGLYDRPRLPVPGETLALKLPLDAVGAAAAAAPHGATRTYRFVWPADGEAPTGDHALASLYLFQQLKPRGLLLLLSALLTERRVCLVGSEGDKLSGCAHAALALLYPFAWQHAFVPVLPPALLPNLVGGQQQGSRPVVFFGLRREHLPVLGPLCGELICVDVDSGEVSWTHEGSCPVPDIYVLPNTSQVVQAAQRLGGAEAAKAAEKLDKAFSKGVAFLQRYTGQQVPSSRQAEEPKPDAANMLAWELSLLAQSRASTSVVWRGGGGQWWQVGGKGEKGLLNDEQQLRDALLVFFVNIVGDASTYLRPVGGGGGGGGGARLQLDRDLYMGSRGMLGDGPALTALLLELVQTRAFAALAEARTEREARFLTAASPRAAAAAGLVGASEAAGPFLRCAEALRARGETFAVKNVQRMLKAQSQQQAQAAQAAALAAGGGMVGPDAGEAGGVVGVGDPTAVGRWTVFHDTALQLTSNSANATADAQRALLSLVEDAHNAALLPSILRAVWSRLGDCRGLKWRHGHKALILLRELLLRGPEAVLSETLSNIALLRSFLEYKGGVLLGAAVGGGQGPGKIREAARELFFLALDGRALLLHRRMLQAARYRRPAPPPRVRLAMEQALGSSFVDVHRVVAPAAAPCPTAPDAASAAAAGSSAAGVAAVGVPDLLSAAVEESAPGGGDDEEGPLLMMEGDALSAFTGAAEPEPKPEGARAGDGAALIAEEQQQGATVVGQWETFPQTFKTGQTPPRPIASRSGSGANSPLVQLAGPFSAAPLSSGQAVPAYGPGGVPLQGGAAGAAPYDPFAEFENMRC